jgi:serine/threonine protein kinase
LTFRVAQQLLEAMDAIHRSGWAHGDIKPSNVMWSSETSRIKIVDFGLSSKVRSPLIDERNAQKLSFII